MSEVHVVGDVVATLGECPVWRAEEQALYWEDIEGKAIHRYDPSSGDTTSRYLDGRPGSFVFTQTPGRLLVAIESELRWLDWNTGRSDLFTALEDPPRGNRMNDGRCDPSGRFVVGSMHPDPDERQFTGSLYSVDSSGAVTTLETDVGIPNGLVFDADRRRMYWADTFHATIWVWDYDADTGERRNKRVFFNYRNRAEAKGLPDGACLDAEGCYWSASVHGYAATRITPNGDVDRVVALPVEMPTMTAFGGPDLSTLYVTSLQGQVVDKDGVSAGSLLAIDVGVQGVLDTPFAS